MRVLLRQSGQLNTYRNYSLNQIIFPVIRPYIVPNMFQNNWAPKMMPNTNLALTNDFNNYQLGQMQQSPGGYPNQGQVYPQNQGYNQGQGNGQGQGYNQGQGYGQGQYSQMEQTEMRMYWFSIETR